MTHALKAWADWYVSCAGGNVPHEAQAAYDAIDEIARLQSEVERLTYDLEWMTTDRGKWQDSATRRHFERDAAHNDAIEAAYQAALTCDGALNNAGAVAAKIRALKITTQEQPK